MNIHGDDYGPNGGIQPPKRLLGPFKYNGIAFRLSACFVKTGCPRPPLWVPRIEMMASLREI